VKKDRTMSDEEAADYYADPANQTFDPTRVVRPRGLADSLPVRFPPELLERVRHAADADGVTVSEWVRQAVADTLTQRDQGAEDNSAIARELERLARKLRRSA
jgi:predicted HicB family RNase H-like nuclease